MKIIVDDKIPYIKGALEAFAEVVYLSGKSTTRDIVKDADALVTRTRTICDRQILQGSKVKLIATATIGFDHIDTAYCKQAGIKWVNAPGCNAQSVNQYILSALISYSIQHGLTLKGKTIGIVGVGHVGSRIAQASDILGMNVLLNDLPRERLEGSSRFVSLQTIQQQADIITFHVPLNRGGPDNTYHMVNEEFLHDLIRKPLIINTCRGEVFESDAVYSARATGGLSGLIIDCWENEPELDLRLLDLSDYGTPHIAGYSRDGKANGTTQSVRAVSRFFGLGIDDWEPWGVEAPVNPIIELDGENKNEQAILAEAVLSTYEIESDDRLLRNKPSLFEQLRADYPVRREFDSWLIKAINTQPETLGKLKNLGFTIMAA